MTVKAAEVSSKEKSIYAYEPNSTVSKAYADFTKTDRLNELNALLNVDKRENEIVGGEPDEGEEPPEKKPRDLER